MKKILFLCLIAVLFCSKAAFCDSYFLADNVWRNVSTEAATEWGNPFFDKEFIQDANRQPLGFRIKAGWACCTNLSWEQQAKISGDARTKEALVSVEDDLAIMAYIARKIYAHGGYFCLTQLAAASAAKGPFRVYNQQPNWPEMPCVVLCEPGWDGPECKTNIGEGKTGQDTPCDTTDISSYVAKVKRSQYANNDSFFFHKWRPGTADEQEYFVRDYISNRYEHIVYLGATDFMTHGVVAQPMLVGVVGAHPVQTIITSGPANSGKTKVLCAQGFTKNENCEINSKNCGSNVWCGGYSDSNFKSNIHTKKMRAGDNCNIILCKDRSKALDSNFNCVEYDGFRKGLCEKEAGSLYGKLVECGEGYIFDKETCSCVTAKSVSKDLMQYGPRGRNTNVVNDQCWTKETLSDFKTCLGI